MCRPHFLKLISVQCVIRPCRPTFPSQINSRACTAIRHHIIELLVRWIVCAFSMFNRNVMFKKSWWLSTMNIYSEMIRHSRKVRNRSRFATSRQHSTHQFITTCIVTRMLWNKFVNMTNGARKSKKQKKSREFEQPKDQEEKKRLLILIWARVLVMT